MIGSVPARGFHPVPEARRPLADYVKIATLPQLPPGSALEVEYSGRIVALFRDESGVIRALDGICPHQGGPLASGHVGLGVVTCPWHGWSFDLETGCSRLNPRIVVPTFPVRVEDDAILVRLPASAGVE
jgi:nitrite reductase/ring-hydroxylating ferredoxin subunit